MTNRLRSKRTKKINEATFELTPSPEGMITSQRRGHGARARVRLAAVTDHVVKTTACLYVSIVPAQIHYNASPDTSANTERERPHVYPAERATKRRKKRKEKGRGFSLPEEWTR